RPLRGFRPRTVRSRALPGRRVTEVLQIPFSLFRQEWIDETFEAARKANVGIIAREPLGNGFLTATIRPDARFPPGDIRHHWPPAMVAGRVAAAKGLSFLAQPDRTV